MIIIKCSAAVLLDKEAKQRSDMPHFLYYRIFDLFIVPHSAYGAYHRQFIPVFSRSLDALPSTAGYGRKRSWEMVVSKTWRFRSTLNSLTFKQPR